MNKYIVSVKQIKEIEPDTFKYAKVDYIVHGYSFTDAEAVIYERLGETVKGTFEVVAIKVENISEFIKSMTHDDYWKVKFSYAGGDESKGKRVKELLYVTAENVKEVYELVNEFLNGGLYTETAIDSVVAYPALDDVFYPSLDRVLENTED